MKRLLLNLLIVVALLANQAAACVAQSHPMADGDHSTQAHIHLHGDGHVHASHDDHHHHDLPGIEFEFEANPLVDHDADALFLSDQDDLRKQSHRTDIRGISVNLIYQVVDLQEASVASKRGQNTPFVCFAISDCAIFMQTSRLLI